MFIYYVFAVDSFTNKYAYALKQWSEFYLLRFAKTHSHSFTHSSRNNVNVFNLSATGTVKHCQASVLRADLHYTVEQKQNEKLASGKQWIVKGKSLFLRSAQLICIGAYARTFTLNDTYYALCLNYTHAKQFRLEWQRHFTRDYCTGCFVAPSSLSDSYTFVRIRWIPVMCVQMDEVSFEVKKKKRWQAAQKKGKREKPEQQISFDVHTECVGMKNGIHRAKRTDSLLKIGSGRNAHNYTVVMAKTLQIHQ